MAKLLLLFRAIRGFENNEIWDELEWEMASEQKVEAALCQCRRSPGSESEVRHCS